MRASWVVLAACGSALPATSSQGGEPWHELTTEHFTLWTDAPVERGRELVEKMEHLRSTVYGVAFPDFASGGRTFAIAFRSQRESSSFTPPDHSALTYWGTNFVIRRPLMVLYADPHHDDQVVTHELTHAVSFAAVQAQPRWFAEGLATYFENLRLDAGGMVEVGRPPENFVRALERERLVPTAELFACVAIACADERFYLTAWALFTYLHDKQPAELARLEQSMNAPTPNAWRAILGDPLELDHALADFLRHGGHAIYSFRLSVRVWPVTERALNDADVLAVRGLLHWARRPDDPVAANEIVAALAIEPTNVLARVVDVALHHPLAIADARAITVAHPDDWQAWRLLATVATGDELVAARKRMCELVAQNAAIETPKSCAPTP